MVVRHVYLFERQKVNLRMQRGNTSKLEKSVGIGQQPPRRQGVLAPSGGSVPWRVLSS